MNVVARVLVVLALLVAQRSEPRVMAHCCAGDKDVIFAWDGDDGAPLAANFTNIIDAVLGAGTGINGTNSLHSPSYTSSAGFYAEASHAFANTYDSDGVMLHGDECKLPRRDFAIGGYFNGKNTYDAITAYGFFLFEIKDSGDDDPIINSTPEFAEVLLGVLRYGRHLKVQTVPDQVGGVDAIIVTNVFDHVNFTPRFIEIIGSIGSADEALLEHQMPEKGDGWVELRIDGVPMVNGDDFEVAKANYLKGIERPCVTPRVSELRMQNSPRGWNIVSFAPQGDADCLYIKEKAAFCNDVEENPTAGPSPDCKEPGPGTEHAGGFPVTAADYVAPTGGGISATASDPTDPQSLTGITTPLVSLDITMPTSFRRCSQAGSLVQSGRAPAVWQINRISPIEYARSDRFGHVRPQTWDVEIADPDGDVRNVLNSASDRFYRRWLAQLFIEDDAQRLAGTARLSLARARCVSANTTIPQVVTLTFSDELSYPNSPVALERQLPLLLVSEVFQPGTRATGLMATMEAPEANRGVGIPVIFGEASDEKKLLTGGMPFGICAPVDVGDFLLKAGSETWRGWVICQYAAKKVAAAFGSNLHPECPASVRLDPDLFSTELLLPNLGNWSDYFSTPYIDVVLNGVTTRVTMMFSRGPRSEQAVKNIVPFSVNVWGKEDVGDGSGTLITDGGQIVQAMYHWLLLQRARLGTEAMPTFTGGTAKFRTSSAVAVTTIHQARLAGGYPGAFIIDDRRAGGDWLGAALVSYGLRVHTNHHGQQVLTTLNEAQSLSALSTFTDVLYVRGDTFKTTSDRAGELENARTYDYGPQPATGQLTGPAQTARRETSITNWDASGEPYKGDELHLVGVYDGPVAQDVVARALLQTEEGITKGEWATDLDAFAVKPGDLFRLTDFRGLGATGWTRRVLQADSIVVNPNMSDPPTEEDMGVLVRWEDVHPLLVAPSGMVGGGVTADGITVSRVGFNPLGSSAGLTGWVLGSSAAGTGWRLG